MVKDSKASSTNAVRVPSGIPVCRFYSMPGGCRRGIECPFRHGDAGSKLKVASGSASRAQEINELSTRFPNAELDEDMITISFTPSDPDFPFDLSYLHITMLVPEAYPAEPPVMTVVNTDIPRGFALNIEQGFEKQIVGSGKTLLEMINELDARLEDFLTVEKRETIKIVNIRSAKPTAPAEDAAAAWDIDFEKLQINDAELVPERPKTPEQIYTDAELEVASMLRERELRQVLVRLKNTKKLSTDPETGDTTLQVPFEPVNKSALPSCLRSVSICQLTIPKLYNLDPCTIKFTDVDAPESHAVESNFATHAVANKDFSLFAHMNFLTQNAATLAVVHEEQHQDEESEIQSVSDIPDVYTAPPEWDMLNSDESGEEESWYEYNDDWYLSEGDERRYYDSNDETEQPHEELESDDESVDETATVDTKSAPRGVSINIPGLRLINVGVLECTLLNLTVKCSRCKTETEMNDVKAGHSKEIACGKCSSVLAVAAFVAEFMHQHSPRVGYIDLQGCTPVDMRPSAFMPACGTCGEPLPGKTGISGLGIAQTMSTYCRSCHAKMSFFIPQVKFSRVADEPVGNTGHFKKRATVSLGIVAGTPLPFDGTCKHYRRSTRWFRFSCCQRVFPCDKCHNEHSDHLDEHANRMICGMCSREQNYRPEMCGYCRHSFIRRNTGFWEGGRGTRDKAKMSRKDPRKYKRRGKPIV
ncbi:hypothetical protein V1512DRAFT_292057 [Lipomyces arxii]|uniref:uncharacterized protein n=1 Tax=Lipomyces arxii TaxID=56418 RepID=UPI0034CD47D0